MGVRVPAAEAAALSRARARIAAGVLALAAAAILLHLQVAPIPTWFYVFAWYPTLLVLDQTAVLLGGESLLARPRALLAMLWWSAVIWYCFEALNFRLKDWYYVFLPAHRVERWVGITLSLATVVPAVLLPERVLDRLGVWRRLETRPVTLRPRDLRLASALGWGTLAATLVVPRYLHPLTWGAVWLIVEPLLYRVDPERSLFGDMTRGRWGRIARLLAAGLFAGAVWESFNSVARGKWIYTVPFLEQLKVFEMPLIGFLGFPFFALEVWSLYHLLAPHTRFRTLAPSVALAVLVLVGMDRWTVSSTTPLLADLPGVPAEERERLRQAGWTDVFWIARAPVAELAYRANLTPDKAHAAHDAARLSALRGIGTRHAAALIAGGIGTVEALAAADPDSVWRIAHRSVRPTPAEVRVWIRAARRAAGSGSSTPDARRGTTRVVPLPASPIRPLSDRHRLLHCGPLGDQVIHHAELASRIAGVPCLEVLQPGAMRLFGERLEGVGHPHQVVASLKRVSRGVPRAAIGVQSGDVEPGDAPFAQRALELGVEERTVGLLAEYHVARLGSEPGDDLGVLRPGHGVWRPLAQLGVAGGVRIGGVDDRHARPPRRG